jgi:N-acetylglucosamine-6-phosphate deacetylase
MRRDDLKDHIPGIHLEGPFISDADGARGAHNARWIQKPNLDFFDQLVEWSDGNVKLLTIAAELEGSDALCRHAVDKGVAVSLGHQMATDADLHRLADSGASLLTHLGNGIPQTIDRHDNPIWAGLAHDGLTAMIITDGHHLPSSLIKTILKVKGASNTIIVSDASPIAGLSPGNYSTLGNEVILEKSGRLYNPKTGYLVGSSSTMIDCMNYLHSLQLLNKKELFDLGFFNPLRFLSIAPDNIKARFNSRIELEECFIFFDGSIF